MADHGWKRAFEDPDTVAAHSPAGHSARRRRLHYKLPKSEQDLREWQPTTEALMMAAEDRGPLIHAHGVLRALNRHDERVFNLDWKDPHWGKRKLIGSLS
jgi:hypothetical protein